MSAQFGRALAKMGIRLWHSKPGEPAGRGKIERFFRTVRDQFEVELLTGVETMAELERLFGPPRVSRTVSCDSLYAATFSSR